ncbi:hypothetical protein C8R47DRAFT_1084792 [Mycena vitilis]|nr:hypothetical protein C8R47DRAFT_1084792 [Mycena vitilis]
MFKEGARESHEKQQHGRRKGFGAQDPSVGMAGFYAGESSVNRAAPGAATSCVHGVGQLYHEPIEETGLIVLATRRGCLIYRYSALPMGTCLAKSERVGNAAVVGKDSRIAWTFGDTCAGRSVDTVTERQK